MGRISKKNLNAPNALNFGRAVFKSSSTYTSVSSIPSVEKNKFSALGDGGSTF